MLIVPASKVFVPVIVVIRMRSRVPPRATEPVVILVLLMALESVTIPDPTQVLEDILVIVSCPTAVTAAVVASTRIKPEEYAAYEFVPPGLATYPV